MLVFKERLRVDALFSFLLPAFPSSTTCDCTGNCGNAFLFFFSNDLSVLFLPLSDCISSAMGLRLPVLVMLSASGNC